MNRKEHLTPDGLQEIINIKASINKGLIDETFSNVIPVPRPLFQFSGIPDPHWVSGFVA